MGRWEVAANMAISNSDTDTNTNTNTNTDEQRSCSSFAYQIAGKKKGAAISRALLARPLRRRESLT